MMTCKKCLPLTLWSFTSGSWRSSAHQPLLHLDVQQWNVFHSHTCYPSPTPPNPLLFLFLLISCVYASIAYSHSDFILWFCKIFNFFTSLGREEQPRLLCTWPSSIEQYNHLTKQYWENMYICAGLCTDDVWSWFQDSWQCSFIFVLLIYIYMYIVVDNWFCH